LQGRVSCSCCSITMYVLTVVVGSFSPNINTVIHTKWRLEVEDGTAKCLRLGQGDEPVYSGKPPDLLNLHKFWGKVIDPVLTALPNTNRNERRERKEGPPHEERGDCMGDGLLQSQFGANLHPKRAKDEVNVVKGGKARMW
jgi:hypothetical protein